jgi:hypothetical protein
VRTIHTIRNRHGTFVRSHAAGHVAKGKAYGDSETELFAGVCGPAPTDVVMTWAEAEKLLRITG